MNVMIVLVNPNGLDVDRLKLPLERLTDLEAAQGKLAAYVSLSHFSPPRQPRSRASVHAVTVSSCVRKNFNAPQR